MTSDHTQGDPILLDGFALAGEAVLHPMISVTPFSARELATQASRASTGAMDAYLAARYPGKCITYTRNGRTAIRQALDALQLRRSDIVTILTTTGNSYVSGCVTAAIENVCGWSRALERRTRAILVIHEFGYPYENLEELQDYGLPIIEDSSYAFASQNTQHSAGKVGEYVVLSFPKYFAIPFGGALVHSHSSSPGPELPREAREFLNSALDVHVGAIGDVARRRHANFDALSALLRPTGCAPRFPSVPGHVPGVFLCRVPEGVDLPRLKAQMYQLGVECSVFYGERAFFLPVHQCLSYAELRYIAAAFTYSLTAS